MSSQATATLPEGVVAGLKDLGKTVGKDVLVTDSAISNQGKGLIASGEMFGSTCLMPVTEAETAAKFSIMATRRERSRSRTSRLAAFKPRPG